MKIEVHTTYAEMSRAAADIVKDQIVGKPASVLGLATGSTPLGLYKELIEFHRQGLDFSAVTTFNLDEYLGLPPEHPASYFRFMQANLFAHINVHSSRIHIPNGMAEDVVEECARFEKSIESAGGIDLQVLGIGHNGHIGFNEPGSQFGNRTHTIKLAESTRLANARFFPDLDAVPREAISMGIKTIMRAQKILLLASGGEKAAAVKAAIDGPVHPDLPASILQLHPQVTVLLDREAGQNLS